MVLLWLGIRPKTTDDRQKLELALQKILAEDATLAVRHEADGATSLGAASERKLDAVVRWLVEEFHVEAEVTGLDIAYIERLTCSAGGEMKYAVQSGGRGQFAHVKLLVAPGEQGSGFVFENILVGGAIPEEYVKPIEEGIDEARRHGVLIGCPIDDVQVTLFDGSYHDVDSSAAAFRIAAAQAFMNAARKAKPILLEPIMRVILSVPEEFGSRAEAMLRKRRARHVERPSGNEWLTLWAHVPLAATFGLPAEVRALTGGRGLCTMSFAHYAPVALADDDGDRDAAVRAPLKPRTPLRTLTVAVPEPIDDALDDDPPVRFYRT